MIEPTLKSLAEKHNVKKWCAENVMLDYTFGLKTVENLNVVTLQMFVPKKN